MSSPLSSLEEQPNSEGSAGKERQATFDRRYRLLELRERKADRELKRQELTAAIGRGLKFTAAQATVAASVIALISAVAGGVIQGFVTRDVESGKSEALVSIERVKASSSIDLEKQKFETALILKATEAPDRSTQIRNLKFFLTAGFISDPDGKIARMEESTYPSTPPPSSSQVRSQTGAESQISASPLAKRASVAALNLVIESEIGSKQAYEKSFSHPRLDVGGGVTIGIDYDLAYVTPDAFRDAWTGRLSSEAIATLNPYVGITDAATLNGVMGTLSPITVSWEAAVDVFLSKTMPEADARLRASLQNVDFLPPESYGALLSLCFNRGAQFGADGDRYLEMRAIRNAMEARDFAQIPQRIREMKRLYPNFAGVTKRREMEALLFERGFATSVK